MVTELIGSTEISILETYFFFGSENRDPSPRRAAVDTGSKEPREPRRSPASVRGQDPEYRNLKRKRRRKNFSFFKPVWIVFCIQIAQAPSRSIFYQPDVGVDDEKETTAISQQGAVHEELASPTEKRQQQGTTAWATEKNKQFDWGRSY